MSPLTQVVEDPVSKEKSLKIVPGFGGGGAGEEVVVGIQEAKDMATTAQDTADSALSAANAAQTTADEAKAAADASQTTANKGVADAAAAQTTANKGVADAAAAQTTANTAKTTADSALSTANTAKTTADAAKTAASTAQTTANSALSAANTANTTASAAKAAADTANTNATAALNKINSFSSAIMGKLTTDKDVYVGGDNASDTADLGNGRGDSGKPFLTLAAALKYVLANNSSNATINFLLYSTQSLGGPLPATNNASKVTIKPQNPANKVTLAVYSDISIETGIYEFSDIYFNFGGFGLRVHGLNSYAGVRITHCDFTGTHYGLEFSGPGASFYLDDDNYFYGQCWGDPNNPDTTPYGPGLFSLYSGAYGTIAGLCFGSVGGRKYCLTGGSILFASGRNIPANIAGSTDGNSKLI